MGELVSLSLFTKSLPLCSLLSPVCPAISSRFEAVLRSISLLHCSDVFSRYVAVLTCCYRQVVGGMLLSSGVRYAKGV